jgi:hypothetical protein
MAYKVFSNGDALTGGELNTYLMNQSVMVFATTTARDAALTTPNEGMVVWLQDSDKYVYYTGSAWADLITPPSTSGNAIINGAFDIWQRGTSFSNPSGTYTADRFAANGPSGDTVSQQTFTPGAAPVAGYEGQYHLRYATGATAGDRYFFQRVEDVRTLAGQTASFSFWAKVNTGTATLKPYFYQSFGSGGSADISTTEGSFAVTTSWTRFTYTTTMPSVSGKTIGAGSSVQAAFKFSDVSKNLDIWGLQLESGSTATAFKRNASNIQGELAACQRYFIRTVFDGSAALVGTGFAWTSSDVRVVHKFPTTMRTRPTLSGGTASNYTWLIAGSTGNPSSVGLDFADTNSGLVTFGVSGRTAGQAGWVTSSGTAGTLDFSAEL